MKTNKTLKQIASKILFALYISVVAYFFNLALLHTLGTFFLLAPVSFIVAVTASYLITNYLFNGWRTRQLHRIIAAIICLGISILLFLIAISFAPV
ncbi:MAG TPA: hypothetical protein VFT87_05350 [Candidatus Saccharimonadales bacterium]|nr:hypothetical protein [Candidatus Saccharimonadales bacterium]